MTALRLIPLPIHSALEMLLGLAVGVAPFALGLGAPAAFVGVLAGALLVGLALQALDVDLRIGAHLAADQGIALGMAASAAVLAATGHAGAAALFAGAAVAQLILITTTRYTSR